MAEIRRLVREALLNDEGQPAVDTCRVCGGGGTVVGEFCAACGGSGEELDYGRTRGGVGRGPLPWRK